MIPARVWKQAGRMVAVLCCTALVFALFSLFEGAQLRAKTSVSEINNKIAQLEKEVAEAEAARKEAAANYEAVKDDYEKVKARKEALDAELDALEAEVEALRQTVIGYAEQEASLNRRIAAMETELNERMNLLRDRLRHNYEEGRADFLTLLFTSNGLYEFLTSAERLSLLAEQDREMIASCEAAANALRAEKEILAKTVETAAQRSADLHESMKDLTEKQDEVQSIITDLEKDTKTYLAALEEAEREKAKYQAELKKKLEQLSEAENGEYEGGLFSWPLPAKYTKISSPFGNRIHPVTGKPQFHEGIDIPAPYKTEIYCVAKGVVIETGSHYANGKYVLVEHGSGIVTSYAHLSRIDVKKGDILEQGELVGLVGSTGWSTGNHLDLTVYVKGEAVDPVPFFKGKS
ncbi:MAG: peptidoglycan DD-metalloendopeptidase family protein [Clostridia bacterium]|nr:peptidoglycan DD-metalloendopeptidase family protein [Clostridia bacterium]